MVYCPASRPIDVNLGGLSAAKKQVRRFDSRTGSVQVQEPIDNTREKVHRLELPNAGRTKIGWSSWMPLAAQKISRFFTMSSAIPA
jgi:hypothetical protein